MSRESHQRALRATARVACAAAVFGGCQGKQQPSNERAVVHVPSAASGALPTDPEPAASDEAPAVPPRASASSAPGASASAVAESPELRACRGTVDAARGTGSMAKHGALKSEVKACCQKLAQHYDAIHESWMGDQRSYCCSGLGWTGSMACAPWGPPVPPGLCAARDCEPLSAEPGSVESAATTLDLRVDARAHAPDVDAPAALRDAAVATWRARMVNEHGSAGVFEALAEQLAGAGVPSDTVSCCRRFADEERHHGALCGAVVEALGADAVAPALQREPYPLHADADAPLEAALRNLLSICCLSETVAVALIGAERLDMSEGPLRQLLTRIYADEVGHASFGWRLLPRLLADDAEGALRERLGGYLRVAFSHLEEHELAHLPLASNPPPEGAELGLCSGVDARALFYDAVTEVIVPALEQHGIPAERAWRRRGTRADEPRHCGGATKRSLCTHRSSGVQRPASSQPRNW
jgi:hypothetical protein